MDKPQTAGVAFPFKIEQEYMERLIVINIQGETEFEAIEPQVFDDPVNGKGMRIIMYRKDKKIDVYWQPGVQLTREAISIGAGIANFAETVIEPARFEITPRGVDLDIGFVDAQNRRIEVKIRENTQARHPFPFLAPVGKDVETPTRLFLVHTLDFDFIKRKGTDFFCTIGEQRQQSVNFPLLRGGKRTVLIRYCANPAIASLNPAMSHPVVFESGPSGKMEIDGMILHIDSSNRLKKIGTSKNPEAIALLFPDGFPNLYDVPDNSTINGPWTIRINAMQITGGTYSLSRSGSTIACTLSILEKWKPVRMPLSVNLFTRLFSWFRTWPTTYRWNALIDLDKNTMDGHWERV